VVVNAGPNGPVANISWASCHDNERRNETMSKVYVEPYGNRWQIGHVETDYEEHETLTKDELLEMAHLLIKAYRRACQKEENGI